MSSSAQENVPREAGEERELCRSCLTPNQPEVPFCKECGAPLSSYASTAPFESIFSEGHVYRSAVERPHKPIVLLGIWILFGCLALAGTLFVYLGLTSTGIFSALMGLFMFGVSLVIMVRTTKNYLAARKVARSVAA